MKELNSCEECPRLDTYPQPDSGFFSKDTKRSYCIFSTKVDEYTPCVIGEPKQCHVCRMFFR